MTRAKTTEKLPKWNLAHLVAGDAPREIMKTLGRAEKEIRSFQKDYRGKLDKYFPAAFGRAIVRYEQISETTSRAYSYASLDRQTKLDDAKSGQLYQTVMERTTDLSTGLLFFTLDINKMSDKALMAKLRDKSTARYKPFLDRVRAFRPHQLPDEIEKTLHERSVTGAAAWMRLYDETTSRLRFPVGGKMLTETEVFHLMLSRDAKKRRAAAKAVEKVFAENIGTFALILNTLAKEKDIDDKQRGFKSVTASRNLDNQVEDEVVEALVKAVRVSYPRLAHRYYKLKAGWMGRKKLDYWDRNAPLPFSAERKISWNEAERMVTESYGRFHPSMAKIVAQFFRGGWIDAAPRAGKDSGAFSASTVPSVHPYILMNFKGGIEDVMTLAHELGHGIHQMLAAKQGYLMADTPLTLAETASVFGEMLTFQSLLASEKSAKNKKALLAKKVEDMLNTVVRQIAFHEFEKRFHTERKSGELTPARIGEIWMAVMKESLGPAFRFEDGYKNFWAYISHFYHSPFYVYAYAFGDCLVNALYGVYEHSDKGFAEKYLRLLAAGGTERHGELLKPFRLNARDPKFWATGLSVIEGFIDQLESAENAAKVPRK